MTVVDDLQAIDRAQSAGVIDLSSEVRRLAARAIAAERCPKDRPTAVPCKHCGGLPYYDHGECGGCDPLGPPWGFNLRAPLTWTDPERGTTTDAGRERWSEWTTATESMVRLARLARRARATKNALAEAGTSAREATAVLGLPLPPFDTDPDSQHRMALYWLRTQLGVPDEVLRKVDWARTDDEEAHR